MNRVVYKWLCRVVNILLIVGQSCTVQAFGLQIARLSVGPIKCWVVAVHR